MGIFEKIGAELVTKPIEPPPPDPPKDPWAMLKLSPEEWNLDAMYERVRGRPVESTPTVMLVTTMYQEGADIMMRTEPSRVAVMEDCAANGVQTIKGQWGAESLITRVRQRICQMFLKSAATHLLWWDADIECLTPDCVAKMVKSGHDIIAGACPYKNMTGEVVCILRPEDVESGQLKCVDNCIEVSHAGTGFMLVSRACLYKLMQANPELLHYSPSGQDAGEPLFALYDTALVDHVYLSEDWYFCHLWRKLGGSVHVYVPAEFKHWGIHGFEGSLMKQYDLGVR